MARARPMKKLHCPDTPTDLYRSASLWMAIWARLLRLYVRKQDNISRLLRPGPYFRLDPQYRVTPILRASQMVDRLVSQTESKDFFTSLPDAIHEANSAWRMIQDRQLSHATWSRMVGLPSAGEDGPPVNGHRKGSRHDL
jgi:hypothetical protein